MLARSLLIAALSLFLLLAACGSEVADIPAPPAELPLSFASADEPRVSLSEFNGSYDADTGEFRIELTPAGVLGTEFRTERQASSFCNDFRVNVSGLGVGINTVAGSIGDTVIDCIPAAQAAAWTGLRYAEGGAFCATIRVDNRLPNTLTNVMAEITTVTSGYEGYKFLTAADPACCGTGADVSGYVGENAPTDLAGGVFYHADTVATGEDAEQTWIFRNAGGSFTFSGRIVSNVEELENDLDEDCDGQVDNALNLYADAARCRADTDCVSGLCEEVSIDDGFGACAPTCAPGTYGLSCAACGICSSGECNDGAAGDGECECDDGFGGSTCVDCLPGAYGATCESVCVDCGVHGACNDGVVGSGTCACEGGWSGEFCETENVGVTSPLCGGGWTRVALENAYDATGSYNGARDRNGLLRFLGVVSGDASAIADGSGEGNVAGNYHLGVDYDDIMVTWGVNYACGTPAREVFNNNTIDYQIPLSDFATNEPSLASSTASPGATFCRGAATWTRPGDTSWAIKPANDFNFDCGCNNGGWTGLGVFYGGTRVGESTSCAPWGGGFAGWQGNGQQKGAYNPEFDTAIWVR